MTQSLSPQEKTLLLLLAHDAIAAHLEGQRCPSIEILCHNHPALAGWELPQDSLLQQKLGVFVSVYVGHELRGCIGTFRSDQRLWKNVQQMAIQAASQDPRFAPISGEEQDHVGCEISILTQPTAIQGPGDIEIGRDGLIVETMHRRGVLLPQVATQYHWDAETFLEHTCLKAHLPPDAWKKPTTSLSRFEAIIVSDRQKQDPTAPMSC